MSLKPLDIELVKKYLDIRKRDLDYLKSLILEPSPNNHSNSFHMASMAATHLGLWYVFAGDYKTAKDYFYEALDFQNQWRNAEEKNGEFRDPRFDTSYVYALQKFQTSALTLDKQLLIDLAKELEDMIDVDVKNWGVGKPWYGLIKIIVGILLGWDINKMENIKKETEHSVGSRGEAIGSLGAVWAIFENDIEEFKRNLQIIINSTRNLGAGRPDLIEHYISTSGMMFVILATIQGLNLADFDPPMISMDYINQLESSN